MKALHLTLKKKWFDMILSGEKKEEYREIKPYWIRRLAKKHYDCVCFKNGYQKNARQMMVELKCIIISLGIVEWGAPERVPVYILQLGKIIETKNIQKEPK